MKLSVRLFRNTVANYLGQFVVFAVALFLTPYVIHSLGDTRYAAWTLVTSVSGYLALFDFGMASALSKYTAEYAARQDNDTVDQMASTLFFTYAAVGLAGFLGFLWLSSSFARFFDVPPEYALATQVAVVIMGANFAVALPLSIYNSLVVGYQRYDILRVAVSLAWLLQAGLTVLVLVLGWGLIGLAIVTCTATVAKGLALAWSLKRWISPIRLRLSKVRRTLFKLLLSYSVFMFLMMVCRQVEESTGPVIVGRLVGLDDVTRYSVGVKISALLRQFAFPITMSLFPAFSELDALADRRRLGLLLTQGLRVSALVGMPVAGIAIVLVQPLISFWVGPQYVTSAAVGVVMLLKVLVDQQLLAASSLLNGMARLKLYTGLHVFALLFSLGFSLSLAPIWGAVAVAAASLLAWAIVLVVTIPYTAGIAGVPLRAMLQTALFKPFVATLLACVALFALKSWHPPVTIWLLLIYCAAAALLYGLLAGLYCLSRDERTRLAQLAKQLFLKVRLLLAAKSSSCKRRHGRAAGGM